MDTIAHGLVKSSTTSFIRVTSARSTTLTSLLLVTLLLAACGGGASSSGGGPAAGMAAVKQALGSRLETDTTLLRRAGCYPLSDIAAEPVAEAAGHAAAVAAAAASSGIAVLLYSTIKAIVE